MHGTFTTILDTSAFLAKHGIYINPTHKKIKELQELSKLNLLAPTIPKPKKPNSWRIVACPPDNPNAKYNNIHGQTALKVGDLYYFNAAFLHK